MAEAFIQHADLIREVPEDQRRKFQAAINLLKPHLDGVKVCNVDTKFLLALRARRSKATTRTASRLEKVIDFIRLTLHAAKQTEKCLDELPEFPSVRGEALEAVPTRARYRITISG